MGASTDPHSQSLVVWNLLTASVWWSAATPANCLAVDAKSGSFAVALPREPVRRWVPNQAQAQLPQPQEVAVMDMKGAQLAGVQDHNSDTHLAQLCKQGRAVEFSMQGKRLMHSEVLQDNYQMVALLIQKDSRIAGLAPQEISTLAMPAQKVCSALIDWRFCLNT